MQPCQKCPSVGHGPFIQPNLLGILGPSLSALPAERCVVGLRFTLSEQVSFTINLPMTLCCGLNCAQDAEEKVKARVEAAAAVVAKNIEPAADVVARHLKAAAADIAADAPAQAAAVAKGVTQAGDIVGKGDCVLMVLAGVYKGCHASLIIGEGCIGS